MELNDVKDMAADVLVVGAGPTGLTLAVDLARRGVHARVIERGDGLFPGSRGKGLQPRTQEVFDDLGIIDAVREAGGRYPSMMGWADGERLGAYEMVERTGSTPAEPYGEGWMLPQWRTSRILYARLRELGGDVEFGTALTGLTQDAYGVRARLTYADGSAGTARARYAVAADGGRGTVRGELGIGMTGETVQPEPILVADAVVDGLDRDHWHVWRRAAGGALALCPLAGTGDFQLTALYADPDAVPDTSAEGIRRLVATRTHLDGDAVRAVSWSSVFTPRTALADRFRDGRVLLAGDAAHLHSPAGGQGLNTGVQDAYNLGWKLGQVLRSGADPALLDSYEAERMPVAAGVLGLSTRIHRGQAGRGPDTHQLTLGYREGPLTRECRDAVQEGTVRAGDRAPDAPCVLADGGKPGKPFRLFDAFRGPHFTVLALGGAGLPSLPAGVRAYRVGGPAPDLLDVDGHVAAAYGSGPALCLVRPDGYVACAADDATAVDAVLDLYGLAPAPPVHA